MVIAASGPVSVSSLVSEFNANLRPFRMSGFYRGSAWVPDDYRATDVPAANVIRMSNFRGVDNPLSQGIPQLWLAATQLGGNVTSVSDWVSRGTQASGPWLAASGNLTRNVATYDNTAHIQLRRPGGYLLDADNQWALAPDTGNQGLTVLVHGRHTALGSYAVPEPLFDLSTASANIMAMWRTNANTYGLAISNAAGSSLAGNFTFRPQDHDNNTLLDWHTWMIRVNSVPSPNVQVYFNGIPGTVTPNVATMTAPLTGPLTLTSSRVGTEPAADPYWSSVILYAALDSGISNQGTDTSITATSTNVTLQSTVSKFGSAASFDGTSRITYGGIRLGSGNFTIEFWMYATNSSVDQYVISNYATAGAGTTGQWYIYINRSLNLLMFYLRGEGDPSYGQTQVGSTFIPGKINTWTHVAIVRNGDNIRGWMNGVSSGAVSPGPTTSVDSTSTNAVFVGGTPADTTNANGFRGYIDDLRITKVARYTGTTPFTPPTAPFGPPTSPLNEQANYDLREMQLHTKSLSDAEMDRAYTSIRKRWSLDAPYVWLDASVPALGNAAVANVTTWADKGNYLAGTQTRAFTGTGTGTARPQVMREHGMKFVRVSSTGNTYLHPSIYIPSLPPSTILQAPFFSANRGYTIAMRVRLNTTTGNVAFLDTQRVATITRFDASTYRIRTVNAGGTDATINTLDAPGPNDSAWKTLVFRVGVNRPENTFNLGFFVDGVLANMMQSASTDYRTDRNLGDMNLSGTLRLGGRLDGRALGNIDADYREFQVWDRALSNAEVVHLCKRLETKWTDPYAANVVLNVPFDFDADDRGPSALAATGSGVSNTFAVDTALKKYGRAAGAFSTTSDGGWVNAWALPAGTLSAAPAETLEFWIRPQPATGNATVLSNRPIDPFAANATIFYASYENGYTNEAPNSPMTYSSQSGTSTTASGKFGTAVSFTTSTSALVYNSLALGTSDFTIEFWVRISQTPTGTVIICHNATTWGNGGKGFYVQCGSNMSVRLWAYTSIPGAYDFAGSSVGVASLNTWHHFAWVRRGTTMWAFWDGVQALKITAAVAAYDDASNTTLSFGTNPSIGPSFIGLIDDVRVTKAARYTATFTPPSELGVPSNADPIFYAPFIAGYDNVALGGSIALRSSTGVSISASGRFGNAVSLEATTSRITYDNLSLGTANFTVELWVNPTASTGSSQYILHNMIQSGPGTSGWGISRVTSGMLRVFWTLNGVATVYDLGVVNNGTWYHVAWVRRGVVSRGFLNGVRAFSETMGTLAPEDSVNTSLFVGSRTIATDSMVGLVDEIRITRAALYWSAFTPPTTPLQPSGYWRLKTDASAIAASPRMAFEGVDATTGNVYGLETASALTANAWTHVAVTKDAGWTRMYVNGVLDAQKPFSINEDPTYSTIYAGNAGGGQYGLDNLRITTASRYSPGSFTPGFVSGPGALTTIQDPRWANVALYAPLDATNGFADVGPDASAVAVIGTPDPVVSSVGASTAGSATFVAGEGYLRYTNGRFAFGTEPFTAEFWAAPTSATGNAVAISTRTDGAAGVGTWNLGFAGGKVWFLHDGAPGVAAFEATGTRASAGGSIATTAARHVAMVRDSAAVRVYLDGILDMNVAVPASLTFGVETSASVCVGSSGSAADAFGGAIDEVRVTRAARYAANFAPTPLYWTGGSSGPAGPIYDST